MATEFERQDSVIASTRAEVDEGLRAYMLRVYNYMTIGLALTGVVAYLTASSPALMELIYFTPLKWVVFLAPLAMIFMFSARIHKMSFTAAQTTYWIFAGLMGLSLASIFLIYTGGSIAKVFFISAAMFASLSLFGYTTKRDLTGVGNFMFLGLIGIIIAMIVNIFLASAMMDFVISVIGVIIFAGLTAYDTQKIKEIYHVNDDGSVAGKKAVWGALRLYLDFLNMFLFLLHLFGNR